MKTYTDKLNDVNLADYSDRTNGNFRRQLDKDLSYDKLKQTNWKSESDYFNSYHRKPKGNMIKCSNKEYLKRLNNV